MSDDLLNFDDAKVYTCVECQSMLFSKRLIPRCPDCRAPLTTEARHKLSKFDASRRWLSIDFPMSVITAVEAKDWVRVGDLLGRAERVLFDVKYGSPAKGGNHAT